MTGAASQLIDADTAARLPALTLEVRTSPDALAALAPEWQDLLLRCPRPSLFMSPAWHLAWCRCFAASEALYVIALRQQRRLIGLIPLMFYRDRLRGLPVQVLGTYNNEHASRSDMLIEPGYEIAVAEAVVRSLQAASARWDVLMLRQLPATAAWLRPFADACRSAGLSVFGPTPGTGRCVLPLRGSWDDYLSRQTRNFRAQLRKGMSRVQKYGEVVYRRSAGTPEDFDTFLRLEQSSWKQEDSQARLGARGWDFQREVALVPDSGISCYNLFLEIDGQVFGGMHALGYRGTAYSMQTLFNESIRKLGPGRAQCAVHISDMFADGRFDTLDFNGNSPFCKSWTGQELRFVDLQVYNRRPYSLLLSGLKRLRGKR